MRARCSSRFPFRVLVRPSYVYVMKIETKESEKVVVQLMESSDIEGPVFFFPFSFFFNLIPTALLVPERLPSRDVQRPTPVVGLPDEDHLLGAGRARAVVAAASRAPALSRAAARLGAPAAAAAAALLAHHRHP